MESRTKDSAAVTNSGRTLHEAGGPFTHTESEYKLDLSVYIIPRLGWKGEGLYPCIIGFLLCDLLTLVTLQSGHSAASAKIFFRYAMHRNARAGCNWRQTRRTHRRIARYDYAEVHIADQTVAWPTVFRVYLQYQATRQDSQ